MNLFQSKMLYQGLLFSALFAAIFKIFFPLLNDNFISALILFIIPALLIYLLLSALIAGLFKTDGKINGIVTGILWAVFLTLLTGFELTYLMLIAAGLAVTLLSNRKILSWLIFVILISVCLIPANTRLKIDHQPELLIVGFDAMKPEIADSLVTLGDMPNLGKLIENGSWGPLQSDLPMVSPILWTMIGSGYEREKTGLTGFFNISTQIRVPRIWQMLQQKGWSVGVFRWLLTWPPTEVDGFMVPDLLARDNTSYPSGYGEINGLRDIVKSGSDRVAGDLIQSGWQVIKSGVRGSTLLRLAGAGITLNTRLKDQKIRYKFSRKLELEVALDIFINLMNIYRPRFAAFYDNGIDIMGHRMWKFFEPEGFEDVTPESIEKYGSNVSDMYRYSDSVLGRLLAATGDKAKIAVVSDHGMKQASVNAASTYFINIDRLFQDLELDKEFYSQALNVHQFIYPVSEMETEDFLEKLQENLQRLKFAGGSQLFTIGHSDGLDYYLINNSLEAPGETLLLDGLEVDLDDYLILGFTLSGAHSLFGTVVLSGDNVKKGGTIAGASVIDITPTLLHWAGLPVGMDMDGKVLMEVFENPSEVKYIEHYDYPDNQDTSSDAVIDEQTKDRLRALGYVK